MTALINQIRAAQVRAAEEVVVANLQSMGLATESPRPALTSREITAMTAHAAAIKAANDAYTQGRLSAGQMVSGMRVDGSALFNGRGEMIAMAFTSDVDGEADARRLAACWNVCEGIPTETLESCAHWSDIVKSPLSHRLHIPAEAAAIGAVLDGESLEQGDPSCI